MFTSFNIAIFFKWDVSKQRIYKSVEKHTAQKMKFSIKDFFIFCTVIVSPEYLNEFFAVYSLVGTGSKVRPQQV